MWAKVLRAFQVGKDGGGLLRVGDVPLVQAPELTDLDAILVTHQHPDHLDPEHVPALIKANPQARVMVEPSSPRS